MKLRIVAAGVALALALTPAAVDARSQSGFSSSTPSSSGSSGSSTRSAPAASTTSKPEAGGAGRNSGGFSAYKSESPAPKADAPRPDTGRNGFSAFSKSDDNKSSAPSASPTQQPTARSSNGFSSAGVAGAGVGAAAAVRPAQAQPSAVDRLAQKSNSQSAFAKFRQEQAAFKAPPVAPPASQSQAKASPIWNQYGSGWQDPTAYARQRQGWIDRDPELYNRYYRNPPSFIRSAAYGAIAGGFLALVLDHANDPGYGAWAYSHQNDPGYTEWHREMMEQASQNSDLREKLARLDQQVADMKAQNAPTTTALPQGVDASMVVAPETAAMATTADEPTGHPVWTFIKWSFLVILVLLGFLAACVFVSQRKKAYS